MYAHDWIGSRIARKGALRGFTLIELLVVVIIIATLAVLAIPTITARMRDRRTQQLSQQVASMYRTARMRSMGRGSAILVRYDETKLPASPFEVREAVQGSLAQLPGCAPTPASNCAGTAWVAGNPNSQIIPGLEPTFSNSTGDTQVVEMADAGAARAQVDICFTPMGRSFIRYTTAPGAAFAPLNSVPSIKVYRVAGPAGKAGDPPLGIERTVFVLPNGTARLGL